MATTNDVTIVLLVGTNDAELGKSAAVLRSDGHEVVEATSFEDARAMLSSLRPDLLVTRVQLGSFNGLHLVWQRRIEQPGQPSIVLSAYPDAVLEAEARKLDCPFLVAPVEPDVLLTAVHTQLGVGHVHDDKRRWPRIRIGPELELHMQEGPATIVDVSYGGCRLRFHQGADVPLTRALSLPIPTAETPVSGIPVWKRSALDGDVYGVSVVVSDETPSAWRAFVDGVIRRA